MALAWNAGWVNSPRGFKSRILRTWAGWAQPSAMWLVASADHELKEGYGPQSCGGVARVVLGRRGRLVLLLRPATLAGVARPNVHHSRHGAADCHGRYRRPGRAASVF